MPRVQENDRVFAQGYGSAEVLQAAEFDTLIQIRLENGETAWTDSSLVTLDTSE